MHPKTNKIQTLSFLCFFICNFPIFLKYFYRLGKSVCIKIINHLAISADMFWHSCFRMLHANSLLGLLRLLELCWCHIVIKWYKSGGGKQPGQYVNYRKESYAFILWNSHIISILIRFDMVVNLFLYLSCV